MGLAPFTSSGPFGDISRVIVPHRGLHFLDAEELSEAVIYHEIGIIGMLLAFKLVRDAHALAGKTIAMEVESDHPIAFPEGIVLE